ncbi:MAG TPA: hypothetical protein VN039_02695 [Nitrospira sp.]|jgi:hypothetical protein|nr:hypothetical protein [Nitrospira sp.]
MTDTKSHAVDHPGSLADSLEGRVFTPTSLTETAEAVELAFDYRGDVTLLLRSGESIAGYLFNRQAAGGNSYLELFPVGHQNPQRIPYQSIESIAFTGEDTANGKSWEAWVSKKDSERRAEAEQIEADARTKGYL